MAASTTNATAEFDALAADLIASGEFPDKQHVLSAAVDALRRERIDEAAYNEACTRAMHETESSEVFDGDLIAEIRAHFHLFPATNR